MMIHSVKLGIGEKIIILCKRPGHAVKKVVIDNSPEDLGLEIEKEVII